MIKGAQVKAIDNASSNYNHGQGSSSTIEIRTSVVLSISE